MRGCNKFFVRNRKKSLREKKSHTPDLSVRFPALISDLKNVVLGKVRIDQYVQADLRSGCSIYNKTTYLLIRVQSFKTNDIFS